MNYGLHIILSFWMLLATMPFSINMHYCSCIFSNLCSSQLNCCSIGFEDFETEQTIENLCCSTDCCSELSITSIPKEQFKNTSSDKIKNLTDFVGLVYQIPSYKIQQNNFISKIKETPPLLVKKVFSFHQCFLC